MKNYIFIGALLCIMASPAYAAPSETAEDAARHLFESQISSADIEKSLQAESAQLALSFQAMIQPKLGRALLDDERQQLQFFWYKKLKGFFSYSKLENMLTPILVKNLTLKELQEINRFNDSPVGKKFTAARSIMQTEAKVAGMELGRKLADKTWLLDTQNELREQFPQWATALDK